MAEIKVKHDEGERQHIVSHKGDTGLKAATRDLQFALKKPGMATWEKSLLENHKERMAKHKSSRGKVASKMKNK